MSGVQTWVDQVEQVLSRAQSLFADPTDSGGPAAERSSATLSDVADRIGFNAAQRSGDSGQFASGYQQFTAIMAPRTLSVATDDTTLQRLLDQAADLDRHGFTTASTILDTASADVATFGPAAHTPAGERALIQTLRDRVGEQQHLLRESTMCAAELTAPLQFLYQPDGVVPYEPPPDDPQPTGIICYIGTKGGDPTQICEGYDVAEISYFDDDGTYIIEDAETGVVRLERPIGPQFDDPTSCWLPPGGTDRTMCGPGTTSWHYPDANGNMISENLTAAGELETSFSTPLGPLLP